MDTFTFNLPTGPCSIILYEHCTLPLLPPSGGIYIVDSFTEKLLKKALNFNPLAPIVCLPQGEAHKNLNSIEKILSTALSHGLARDSLFVGIGGGVITDMTAFAASIYMRGSQLELVPTTLLAMVDASIGGKTGIDFEDTKNCVGTFFPAQKIHLSIEVLASLSESEFRSGLAEVFKTALLYAPKLYQIMNEKKGALMERNPELLLEVVKRCTQAKSHVVERDLHEKGERMYLNLGHTFGHALESLIGFGKISHGDAVAWGIARALELGKSLGITDPDYVSEVISIANAYNWDTKPVHSQAEAYRINKKISKEDLALELIHIMHRDKKKKDGQIRFVLQREINSTLVTNVPDSEVIKVLV